MWVFFLLSFRWGKEPRLLRPIVPIVDVFPDILNVGLKVKDLFLLLHGLFQPGICPIHHTINLCHSTHNILQVLIHFIDSVQLPANKFPHGNELFHLKSTDWLLKAEKLEDTVWFTVKANYRRYDEVLDVFGRLYVVLLGLEE